MYQQSNKWCIIVNTKTKQFLAPAKNDGEVTQQNMPYNWHNKSIANIAVKQAYSWYDFKIFEMCLRFRGFWKVDTEMVKGYGCFDSEEQGVTIITEVMLNGEQDNE